MNNTFKLLGLIALLVIFGFYFASCDVGGGSKQGTLIIRHSNLYYESARITEVFWEKSTGKSQTLTTNIRNNESYTLTLDEGTYQISVIATEGHGCTLDNIIISSGKTVTLRYDGDEFYESY
jgi:hypothetical protein